MDSDWSLPALAYLLGVRGFDAQAALAIATQTATVPDGNPIRPELSFYQQHGWVPATDLFSAEDTIDDATTDYVVSQFAAALGNTQVARELGSRATNWQNVFSSSFKTRACPLRRPIGRSPTGATLLKNFVSSA